MECIIPGLEDVDWSEVGEWNPDPDPIPAYLYLAAVTRAEKTLSSAGSPMLILEYTVQAGEYEGRVVLDFINIAHHDSVVRNIAVDQYRALFAAVGERPSRDMNLLLNKPFILKVEVSPPRIDPDTGKTYSARNNVVYCRSIKAAHEKYAREVRAGRALTQAQAQD
jgi:hypothetical protein